MFLSDELRCRQSTATGCCSAPVLLETRRPARSGGARRLSPSAPTRTRTHPTACRCRTRARPTTSAGALHPLCSPRMRTLMTEQKTKREKKDSKTFKETGNYFHAALLRLAEPRRQAPKYWSSVWKLASVIFPFFSPTPSLFPGQGWQTSSAAVSPKFTLYLAA